MNGLLHILNMWKRLSNHYNLCIHKEANSQEIVRLIRRG